MTKKLVTNDMTIAEIIELYPMTAEVFTDWGLNCAMCHIGAIETIEEGALAHGFSSNEVTSIIEEINEVANEEYGNTEEKKD